MYNILINIYLNIIFIVTFTKIIKHMININKNIIR